MQESLSTSPTWLQTSIQWLASFLAGATLVKLIDLWLNRKKPAAEIHVTRATADEITVRAHSTAGDAVIRMMTRLDDAQTTIDRLRSERDDWEMKAFDFQVELRDSRSANMQLVSQAKLDNHQITKMKAFIEVKGLKKEYIALDTPKEVERPKMEC